MRGRKANALYIRISDTAVAMTSQTVAVKAGYSLYVIITQINAN